MMNLTEYNLKFLFKDKIIQINLKFDNFVILKSKKILSNDKFKDNDIYFNKYKNVSLKKFKEFLYIANVDISFYKNLTILTEEDFYSKFKFLFEFIISGQKEENYNKNKLSNELLLFFYLRNDRSYNISTPKQKKNWVGYLNSHYSNFNLIHSKGGISRKIQNIIFYDPLSMASGGLSGIPKKYENDKNSSDYKSREKNNVGLLIGEHNNNISSLYKHLKNSDLKYKEYVEEIEENSKIDSYVKILKSIAEFSDSESGRDKDNFNTETLKDVQNELKKISWRNDFKNNTNKLHDNLNINMNFVLGDTYKNLEKAHIISFSKCFIESNYTKAVDPANCLLLSPNIHKSLDKQEIYFDPEDNYKLKMLVYNDYFNNRDLRLDPEIIELLPELKNYLNEYFEDTIKNLIKK